MWGIPLSKWPPCDVKGIHFGWWMMRIHYCWMEEMSGMNHLKYSIQGNIAAVTGCIEGVRVLRVPAEIDGFPVKIIEKGAFRNQTHLEKIYLPPTTERIRVGAFQNCMNLTYLELDSEETVFEGMEMFKGARYTMEEYLKMTKCKMLIVEFQDEE